jgi:hypothetical protein
MSESSFQAFVIIYLALFTLLVVAMALALLTPLLAVALTSSEARLERVTAGLGAYIGLMVLIGLYAYAMIPAQYTRNLNFTRLPHSNSLASIHSVTQDQLNRPGGFGPEKAGEVRQEMRQEQIGFALRWLLLSVVGLAVVGSIRVARNVARRTRGRSFTAAASG